MKKEVVNGSMVYIATWHLYLEMRRDRSIELFLVHSIQNLNYKKKKNLFSIQNFGWEPLDLPILIRRSNHNELQVCFCP